MPANDAKGIDRVRREPGGARNPIKPIRPGNDVRTVLGGLPPKREKGPGRCETCGKALPRTGSSYYATKCRAHASEHRKGVSPVTDAQRQRGHETVRAAMRMYRASLDN